MVETSEKFRFHRFGDYVSFFTEKTETLYVSVEMAKKLSEQFSMYAEDIEQYKFSESDIGTLTITEKSENTV